MYQVIIFGSDGYNTLGALQSLSNSNSKDLKVFLLLVSKKIINYTLYSSYLNKYKKVKSEEDGINFLLSIKDNSSKPIVILPTSDLAESHLDRNYDLLTDKFIFPNARKANEINRLMDKYIMTEYAKKSELNVPQTIEYKKGSLVPNNIVFPCIIKPIKSITGSKKDMVICKDINELNDIINNTKTNKDFLIQQYIDKKYDLLLIGVRFSSNKEIVIPGIFKKDRWYLMGEDGSKGVISNNPSKYINIDNIIKFIEDINYFGPFSIEFGVENGTPYFYEINLRNDGTSHYFTSLGINIPKLWVLDSLGKGESEYYSVKKEGRIEQEKYFIDEFGDHINIFTNNLSIKDWLKDIRKASIYKYFSKKDIKPFILMLPRMVLLSLYKISKNI